MTPVKKYNTLLAQKVIRELNSRNISGYYADTKEEALKLALEMVPEGSVVSWGGSLTLKEIGLLDTLRNGGYNILDASDYSKGGAELNRIAHQALNSDYYFMSANAISVIGELVNIDGIGNRVASLIYGPKKVIIIAGINKIESNLEQAILRVKTKAAALGVLSYGKNEIDTFEELLKIAETTCSQLVVTAMSTFKDRIRVILVGENLGF